MFAQIALTERSAASARRSGADCCMSATSMNTASTTIHDGPKPARKNSQAGGCVAAAGSAFPTEVSAQFEPTPSAAAISDSLGLMLTSVSSTSESERAWATMVPSSQQRGAKLL